MDLDEKSTYYYLSLENRNYTSNVINKLIFDDIEYTKPYEVLNCQNNFMKIYMIIMQMKLIMIHSLKIFLGDITLSYQMLRGNNTC